MKRNLGCSIGHKLALIALVASVIGLGACAKPALPTPATSAATPPSNSTPTQRQGVNGTLSKIDGDTLTLTTRQGQTIVKLNSDTVIQKMANSALSELSEGETVTVIGSQDTSGNISATSIMVVPQGQGSPFGAPSGSAPRSGGTGSRPGNTPNPGSQSYGGGNFIFGTLSKIDGNTLTLTTGQGQTTVKVDSDTVIQKTVTGAISDLSVGETLSVIGSQDASGNIAASSITIRPQGQGGPPAGSTATPSGVPPDSSGVPSQSTDGLDQTSSTTPSSTQSGATPSIAYNIGVYSDADCTEPVSNLDWGSLVQGTSKTQSVYVKDQNNQTMTVTVSASNIATSGITFANDGPLSLVPETVVPGVWHLTMSLTAAGTATLGGLDFSIDFAGAVPLSIPSQVSIVAPLVFGTATLPQGIESHNYSGTITAAGGTAPYKWAYSGMLPLSLTLDPASGAISGTLNAGTTGTYNFTVVVTDSSTPQLSSQQSFDIVVATKS